MYKVVHDQNLLGLPNTQELDESLIKGLITGPEHEVRDIIKNIVAFSECLAFQPKLPST